MSIAHQIPLNAVNKIINAAEVFGVKPDELCRPAKLDAAALEDVHRRIPFSQFIGLYQRAANLTGDEAFGLHVGERNNPKSYGMLGYVSINSRTVGEALNRLIRFQQIRTDAYKFSLEIVGTNAHLVYIYQTNDAAPEARRHESEETLCSIIEFGRLMTGSDWIPREVHFEHARPQNISEHQRIFRAPVLFGKPNTRLIFDWSFLKTTLVEADLTLECQAEELLAKSPPDKSVLTNRIRQLMRENFLGGELRMKTICRKSNFSPRTLHRKLREEGTSYGKLLEETQSEMSKFYLRQPEIAICEISCLLGFSQPSAFHRAFRRWNGLTPKAFRNK